MELLLQQKVSEVELVPCQVCARSSKFSLFDPAKEMAYIQMSRAEKRQGKAAVDLIGSQVRLSPPSMRPHTQHAALPCLHSKRQCSWQPKHSHSTHQTEERVLLH